MTTTREAKIIEGHRITTTRSSSSKELIQFAIAATEGLLASVSWQAISTLVVVR